MTSHVQLGAESMKADERASVATRVIRSNRTQVLQSTLVVLFAIAASAASTVCVIYSRPTHVSAAGTLVDADEKPVATVQAQQALFLQHLPTLGAEFNYHSIEKVILNVTDAETGGNVVGFRTVGYSWINETDMDLFLEDARTLHISNGAMVLAQTERNIVGSTPVNVRQRRLQGDWADNLFLGSCAVYMGIAITALLFGPLAVPLWALGAAGAGVLVGGVASSRRLELGDVDTALRELLGSPLTNQQLPAGSLAPY